jgi:hypothetical protein
MKTTIFSADFSCFNLVWAVQETIFRHSFLHHLTVVNLKGLYNELMERIVAAESWLNAVLPLKEHMTDVYF